VYQEHRGLRFAFSADAEIAPENSPAKSFPGHVTELSLQGCFVVTSALFELQHPILLRVHQSGENFETSASVLYIKDSGMGLVFRDVKPNFREVLQKWVLTALDNQVGARQTTK
jgi:hypothetical protein